MEKFTRLRSMLQQERIDGLLITNSYNRTYMTGFTGRAGVVLLSAERALFITDFRYVEQAQKQAVGYEIVQHTGPITEEVAKRAKELGITKLGFEQDTLTYSEYRMYGDKTEAELVPVSGLVEGLRLIKTDAEIKILKEAAQIADAAFTHILSFIRPGVSELAVSNELEFFMRKQGAASSSFDIIVASGHRSALPHGVASEKLIETGEFVTLDFGAYYKGYCSDITRTIAVGEPSQDLKDIYDVVLEAQLRGLDGIRGCVTGKEADALTRDYITEKGYGQYFGHSTGHGIGLEIHEGPGLSIRSDTVLEPGMAVTVEPGIYIAGLGGVRIEDDVIVTKEGNEILTHSPKELIIL